MDTVGKNSWFLRRSGHGDGTGRGGRGGVESVGEDDIYVSSLGSYEERETRSVSHPPLSEVSGTPDFGPTGKDGRRTDLVSSDPRSPFSGHVRSGVSWYGGTVVGSRDW